MLQLVQSRQHISHGKKNLNKQKESNFKKKIFVCLPQNSVFKKTLDWWFGSCVKVKQENGFKIKMYAQVVDKDIWSWVLFHQLIWRLKINYILKVAYRTSDLSK